jgi:hypothetical protein
MATVCLSADTLTYPEGGGHFWVYLNWALGLQGAGCDVVWLESVSSQTTDAELARLVAVLQKNLRPYGLADAVALAPRDPAGTAGALPALPDGLLPIDAAYDADLVLNLCYAAQQAVLDRCRRSVLVDIDPGLLQRWVSRGELSLARHDLYFTIGETVAAGSPTIPSTPYNWIYTPPPVATWVWAGPPAPRGAPYTTVAHWWGESIVEDDDWYENSKEAGFRDYLDLPSQVDVRLELALDLLPDDDEFAMLAGRGWATRASHEIAASPEAYKGYIHGSRGEFSCAKPSCLRFANAWVSDRTLCYLASGRPAVVQHTGPSRFLPDRAGLLRFRTPAEAAELLTEAEANYEYHTKEARALAEEHFDARAVVTRLLERALG